MRLVSLLSAFVARGARPHSVVPAAAQAMTVDEFRRELVGVPLCGTPESGPLAGKSLCTVHLPDGTAILAGAGLVVYGLWEADGGQDLPPQCARSDRQAPLRDLRAGRPQPFPQQRRRRLLPRPVRERQVEPASLLADSRKRPTCRMIASGIALGGFRCVQRSCGVAAIALLCAGAALRGQQAHAEGNPDRILRRQGVHRRDHVGHQVQDDVYGRRQGHARAAGQGRRRKARGRGSSRRTASAPPGRAARRTATRWSMSTRTNGRW